MVTARFFQRLFIFFFIMYVFNLSVVCSQATAELKQQQQKPKTEEIHLGIITLYHPLVMYRKYQPFVDYLTENTPYTFVLKISENYYQIIDYLSKGTIQAAILGGMTYLEAKEKVEITPLLSALGEDGKPFCRGVFITRSDNSKINNIKDQGHPFCAGLHPFDVRDPHAALLPLLENGYPLIRFQLSC